MQPLQKGEETGERSVQKTINDILHPGQIYCNPFSMVSYTNHTWAKAMTRCRSSEWDMMYLSNDAASGLLAVFIVRVNTLNRTVACEKKKAAQSLHVIETSRRWIREGWQPKHCQGFWRIRDLPFEKIQSCTPQGQPRKSLKNILDGFVHRIQPDLGLTTSNACF